MEATDNADIVVAVLSLLKLNFKEAKQNFARWQYLNKRKKSKINNQNSSWYGYALLI